MKVAQPGCPSVIGAQCLAGEPFVVAGGASVFVPSAATALNTFENLRQQLEGVECSILHSTTQRFPYFDAEHLDTSHSAGQVLPTITKGSFDHFLQQLHGFNSDSAEDGAQTSRSQWYCQKGFLVNGQPETVTGLPPIEWDQIRVVQTAANFGAISSLQLFASPGGTTSPLHYDQLHNLFFQISGIKRFILFPPAATTHLVPFPVNHPLDRRSQINLSHGEYIHETQTAAELGQRVVLLQPGDMLYLPPFWWHEVIGEGEENISLSFWFGGKQPQSFRQTAGVGDHVQGGVRVGLGRNLESAAARKISAMLRALQNDGRGGQGQAELNCLVGQTLQMLAALLIEQPIEPQQESNRIVVMCATELASSLGPALVALFGGEGGAAEAAAAWVLTLLVGGRLGS